MGPKWRVETSIIGTKKNMILESYEADRVDLQLQACNSRENRKGTSSYTS